MNDTEIKVAVELKEKGWELWWKGAPDFLCIKRDDNGGLGVRQMEKGRGSGSCPEATPFPRVLSHSAAPLQKLEKVIKCPA